LQVRSHGRLEDVTGPPLASLAWPLGNEYGR
jgi:hypothetical protein